MVKIKTFNSFADMFFGTRQTALPEDEFHSLSINYLKTKLKKGSYSKKDIYNDIIFFVFYKMDKFDLTNELPIAVLDINKLPNKYSTAELNRFNKMVVTLVEHFEIISKELELPSPISMIDFIPLYNQKERMIIDIPAAFLRR